MSRRYTSLRVRLFAGLVLLAFIGVGLQFTVFSRVAERMREDVAKRNLALAHALAGEVGNAVAQPAHTMRELLILLEKGLAGERLASTIQDIMHFTKVLNVVQVLDRQGRVRAVAPHNPDEVGLDYSSQPYFQLAIEATGPVFSDSFISAQTSEAAVTIAQAYGDGVVVMQLSLEELSRMAGVLPPRGGGFIAVIDARGVVIGHTDPEAALRRESLLPIAGENQGERAGQAVSGGVPGILSVSPVQGVGWRVVVFEPASHAYASVTDLYSYTLGGVAVVGICSVLAMLLFQSRLLRPLAELTAQAGSLAGGRYDVAINPAFKEFEPLVESFSSMARNLKAREQALVLSQQRLASVVDAMPSFLASLDAEGRIENWNDEARKLTGVDPAQALGRPLGEAVPLLAPILPAIEQTSLSGLPVKWEKLTLDFGVGRRIVDVLVYPLRAGESHGVVLRIDDITERTRMEEVMVHTEKMMTVGGLAAGMAHEINNPLGGILMSAQNLTRRLDPELPANRDAAREAGVDLGAVRAYLEGRDIFKLVENIRELGARAGRIVSNMLGFSRRSTSGYLPMNPVDIIESSLELAANDYELKKRLDFKSIQVHRDYAPDLPQAPVNRSQIEQVLLNIFKNAAQAMTETAPTRPPELWIEARPVGDEVEISIRDSGPGVPAGIGERVFEPFFTTKEVGQGTGLGLSVSYYIIVTMHKGSIRLDSRPGEGARFAIRLPVSRCASGAG